MTQTETKIFYQWLYNDWYPARRIDLKDGLVRSHYIDDNLDYFLSLTER